MSLALLATALVLGILHVRADYRRDWPRTWLYKPLTMLCITGLVLAAGPPDTVYRQAVLAALLLSLAGDVFLMLRPQRFLAGLFTFLLAHVIYVGAFGMRMGGLAPPAVAAAVVAGGGMLALLWPGLGRLRWPVAVYVTAIAAMVATALSAALHGATPGRFAAAAGATLFLFSDACLGYARFRRPFPAAQALILGSYYPAQALIALSAGTLYE